MTRAAVFALWILTLSPLARAQDATIDSAHEDTSSQDSGGQDSATEDSGSTGDEKGAAGLAGEVGGCQGCASTPPSLVGLGAGAVGLLLVGLRRQRR
ncbi:MYXO-CTERM sorting domain-containing protein [Myxococcota bacterium]|nr:MYXO-CTERM sorting domain-containing protein [Myxococcota bacterium]